MNICICNRCFEKDIFYKNILLKSKDYNCFLCKKNIFFYTDLNFKNIDLEKEILFKKKNNNQNCCVKSCLKNVENFEKQSILLCCKCVINNDDKINKDNYSVVKPDKICLFCNVSLCSEYNFHKNCFNKVIQGLKVND